MAKNHTTFESLQAEILKRAQKALKKNVAPIVKKKLQQSAEQVTGPTSRPSGGIADQRNIVSEVIGDTLITKDIAKPQTPSLFGKDYKRGYDTLPYQDPYGTLFSEWIEEERWEEWPYDGTHTKRDGIPFVSDVQNEINRNPTEIIDALKKAFPTTE